MMTYDERKQLLFRRIKDGLPDELLVNQGDVMPLSIDTPSVPFNAELSQYLDDLMLMAREIIFENQYPFDNQVRPADVIARYYMLQIRIAIEIFVKEGAEGEIVHSESGVSRTYTSSDISPALLNQITPMCSV